jgi:hypothetical protein
VSVPSRPRVAQHEGPARSCILDGRILGWTNCTPCSVAMGIDRSTYNRHRPNACSVRDDISPRDVSGGTNLLQNARVAALYYNVHVEVHVGGNYSTPTRVATQLYTGRGGAAQGDAGVLIGTPWRSTGGHVNHCVWCNEGRYWRKNSAGFYIPGEVLVYDPAADGRASGFGRAATSPDWWSWSRFLSFMAHLHPWGDGDSRTLGSGRAYIGFFPDTEPHAHLRYHGVRTRPFYDRVRSNAPVGQRTRVRSAPSTGARVVKTLARGALWLAYQKTTAGTLLAGSRVWYGNHNGDQWIHTSGLIHQGGTT